MGRKVELKAMIDRNTMFIVVVIDGPTQEERLQIDVMELQQSCDRGDLSRIAWIPGNKNPVDFPTKPVLT